MQAQALYDLSPLLRMMLMGLALALGPLVWVWLRHRGASAGQRLRALTVLTLFLTFDLVLFGAFTRLTDSGLGCPDWPGCYGHASPLGATADISAAQSAMPTGPVTHGKAWVEMVHRYLATSLGVLILVLAAAAWLVRRRSGTRGAGDVAINPWWPTLTLVWVCIQGAFGALTVTMKLFPAIVTLHLLGGFALLALLSMQAVRQAQIEAGAGPVPISAGLRAWVWTTFALLVVQSALGGWVSTNYAVLACTEFPMCQDSWWPDMSFAQGFQVWRELGHTADGQLIGFAALTAIHFVHRAMAVVVLALLLAVAWRLRAVTALRSQAHWLIGLSVLQLVTGLSNVVLDWPLVAAVLHTGGAATLVGVMTWTVAASRSSAQATVARASASGIVA
ncbi:MAG TPA: COX15/CtaA family protein [Burkholderiaceae bacterium]|nr:COX15/CtaA family protein [Burkholderiaceae bacterium]